MTSAEAATGRGTAYALFSRVMATGLSPELLASLRAIEELAPRLREPVHWDEQAADFQELFGFNVIPHATMFLASDEASQHAVRRVVYDLFDAAGEAPDEREVDVDHVSSLLSLMSSLCTAEAKARARAETRRVESLLRTQQRLLQHLLLWVPGLIFATTRHDRGFWSAVGTLMLDLLREHSEALGTAPDSAAIGFTVVPEYLPRDSEIGSPAGIAGYLTTHARCGWYLSRLDIGTIGRKEHLPRGFGDRRQMLQNLLLSALKFERMDAVTSHLQQMAGEWSVFYENLSGREPARLSAALWMRRIDESARVIESANQ